MTKKLLSILILLFGLAACCDKKDDLEVVKDFEKENKYFKAGLKSIHFTIETSPINEVDSVFNSFVKHHNIPTSAIGCKDGIYTGTSPYDAYDYAHTVTIEIKDQKIVAIDYNEVNMDQTGKEENLEYNKEMSVAGTSPSIAYPKMEKQMLDNQNYNQVDAVAGATYSLYRFRYALSIALMKAKLNVNEN